MFRKLALLILSAALLLAGCGPASLPAATPAAVSTAAAITLTDGLGREVTLAGPAQHIVSLAPSNTEILFAIGAGSQVVGRDEFSDYPAEAASVASVGGSMGQYSSETIVNLKPDLVLAAEINPPELVKSLEDLGLTVYYLSNPKTLEEMYANLQIVAELTGQEPGAAALIESLKARVAAVDQKLAGVTEKPSLFYEIDATDPAKPYTYGPGTFGDLLIQRAGGTNIAGSLADPYPQIGLEQIVVSNPDLIVLGDSMWGVTSEAVKARSGWEALDAVKNDRIFAFDDNLVSRPGPRLVDGLEALAKLLHPDLFP